MNKFLICEDDADMQELLNMYLKSRKHNFEIVTLGKDVKSAIDKNDFQFLLLDLNLPDMDGRDVIMQLRADKKTEKLPIIVFSASLKAKRLMDEMDINGVLEKPFDLKELESIIATYSEKN